MVGAPGGRLQSTRIGQSKRIDILALLPIALEPRSLPGRPAFFKTAIECQPLQ